MKRTITILCGMVMAMLTIASPASADDNGLPAKLTIPGNWGDIKLWKGSFDATVYTGFKVVLREKPTAGDIQLFYRNADQASSYTGTYLTWEPGDEDLTVLSEDGLTLMGYFDTEKLEGDNIITQFAMQNRTSNTVEILLEAVYLLDENENEYPTAGLESSGWNAGSFEPIVEEDPSKPKALEILVSGGASLVQPASDGNGMPAQVSIPSNYGDVKLTTQSFDATQYPGFKVVLREKPATGTLQLYYRNADQASNYAGTYLTWEPGDEDMTVLSEDGLTLMGYFDIEKLEGDNVITQFALQNYSSNTVTAIIEHVYLLDEEENEILSGGLSASGWNPATITELSAGSKYSGTVRWTEAGKVGPYSGTVAAGTYHQYTFTMDQALPEGFSVKCSNNGTDVPFNVSGTDVLTVQVAEDYDDLSIECSEGQVSFPVEIEFKSIVREVISGNIETSVINLQENVISRTYYDLSGRIIKNPESGLYLIREEYANGKTRIVKRNL